MLPVVCVAVWSTEQFHSSIFSARLNVSSDGSDVGDSMFQTFAAATGKARSPMVLCNDRGIYSDGAPSFRQKWQSIWLLPRARLGLRPKPWVWVRTAPDLLHVGDLSPILGRHELRYGNAVLWRTEKEEWREQRRGRRSGKRRIGKGIIITRSWHSTEVSSRVLDRYQSVSF